MAEAELRGRRVMLAILALIMVVPVINLRQLFRGEVPMLLRDGDMNLAYAAGMFFSVLLILVWYYAYVGRRKPRIALGLIYTTTACLVVALPSVLVLFGTPLPDGWQVGVAVVLIYGSAGWTLLYSRNVRAFQRYQLAVRDAAAEARASASQPSL
tara:strand:- start:435 stop:899 length:465 start_codon:yes stop_codon:yes gene_type:complete